MSFAIGTDWAGALPGMQGMLRGVVARGEQRSAGETVDESKGLVRTAPSEGGGERLRERLRRKGWGWEGVHPW